MSRLQAGFDRIDTHITTWMNIVLMSAGIVIGATVRGGKLISEIEGGQGQV